MENGEVVLDVGREELALDRPPAASLSSSPKNLLKIFLQNAQEHSDNEETANIENRDGSNEVDGDEEEHSLSLSSTTIDDGNIEASEDNNDYDSIETNEYEIVQVKTDHNAHNAVKEEDLNVTTATTLTASSSEVLSSKLNNENQNVKSDSKKRVRYFHGKPLTSCLKSPVSSAAGETEEKKKGKKSVHYFGDEESCVMEYIEPVDPWRDVRTPPRAEVISFYRNSCQKLRCKPIDKVFKQIQEAPDLSCRAGTLVLRGSRLDNKSCEALESVFRRVQFENLDLENCSLEEDGATALLEMIEFYHATCKLNIACNPKIGMRGWQALCRMLRKTPCLTYLDARRTLLTDMTMPTFGRCLKADPPLKILHLEGVFLSGRPMLILTTAMKYNKILEELYLGDNDLSSSDGPPIGAMLTYNTTLQLLDLRNNQIKDIGLAHIGNGLSDQSELCLGGLCSLILWNNGLTHEGMGYLSDGLVQTNSLKALNLGQNRIGDLGIQKLKIGLIKNKSLHKLGFLNTKLGSEGAVALAEVLADSLTITRIDIRENNIQTAGLMAFSMALKVNQSLLRLDLDKDIRKETGMEQVMQTVLVDIYNFCHRNKQLARQQYQGASSTSEQPLEMSRQSSTSSEYNDSHIINTDDIFHPESDEQDIMPFSPLSTDPKEMPLNFSYTKEDHLHGASSSSPENNTNQIQPPLVDVSKSTQKEILDAISSEAQGLPKDEQSVHILNKPTLNSSDRRATRFSVTKILDSLGTHAAGVANKLVNAKTATMESAKAKKQQPPPAMAKETSPSDTVNTELVNIPSDLNNDNVVCSTEPAVSMSNSSYTEQHNSVTKNRTEVEEVTNESSSSKSAGKDVKPGEAKDVEEVEATESVSILELASQLNLTSIDQNEASANTQEQNLDSQLASERNSDVITDASELKNKENEAASQDGIVRIGEDCDENAAKGFEATNTQMSSPSKEDEDVFISLQTGDIHRVESGGDADYRNNLLSTHPIPVELPS